MHLQHWLSRHWDYLSILPSRTIQEHPGQHRLPHLPSRHLQSHHCSKHLSILFSMQRPWGIPLVYLLYRLHSRQHHMCMYSRVYPKQSGVYLYFLPSWILLIVLPIHCMLILPSRPVQYRTLIYCLYYVSSRHHIQYQWVYWLHTVYSWHLPHYDGTIRLYVMSSRFIQHWSWPIILSVM